MVNTLSSTKPSKNSRLLVPAFGRNQHVHGLAARLFSGVAKQSLRAGVPGLDHAVQILADDRVIRGFDDGNQLHRAPLSATPGVLCLQPRQAEPELARKGQS